MMDDRNQDQQNIDEDQDILSMVIQESRPQLGQDISEQGESRT